MGVDAREAEVVKRRRTHGRMNPCCAGGRVEGAGTNFGKEVLELRVGHNL
jgi:hypothetical protein